MINLRYRLTLEELVKVDRLLTKQKEIALRMLQENIPLDVIARITQLTISELEGCTYGRLLQRQRVITIGSPANI